MSGHQDGVSDRWPSTIGTTPPADDAHGQAFWLLGRHRQLAELVDRIPGVAGFDPAEGGLWIDGQHLADAIEQFDRRTGFRLSSDEEEPPLIPPKAVERFGQMSGTERTRLRLLAMLFGRAEFGVGLVASFDNSGHDLLTDWCRLLLLGSVPRDVVLG